MFSTDETIFEDENGTKSNLDENEIVPETSLKLDLEKKSPNSLRLAKEPTDEETQKIQLDSGMNRGPLKSRTGHTTRGLHSISL